MWYGGSAIYFLWSGITLSWLVQCTVSYRAFCRRNPWLMWCTHIFISWLKSAGNHQIVIWICIWVFHMSSKNYIILVNSARNTVGLEEFTICCFKWVLIINWADMWFALPNQSPGQTPERTLEGSHRALREHYTFIRRTQFQNLYLASWTKSTFMQQWKRDQK